MRARLAIKSRYALRDLLRFWGLCLIEAGVNIARGDEAAQGRSQGRRVISTRLRCFRENRARADN